MCDGGRNTLEKTSCGSLAGFSKAKNHLVRAPQAGHCRFGTAARCMKMAVTELNAVTLNVHQWDYN